MSTHLPNWLHTEITQHWNFGRPDRRVDADAVYYIQLAKAIYASLEEYDAYPPGFQATTTEFAELAYLLAAWLEDFICEAGPWKVFLDRNCEVLGVPLPFLDLQGYDPDYINWQDINFLIWLWLRKKMRGKFPAPQADWLRELSEVLLPELEDAIDDAPATTVYDDFLTITPADDFFAIRERFAWLSQHCYLYGKLDMGPRINAALLQLKEASIRERFSLRGDMVNDAAITISLNEPLQLGGWRVNELAARLFHTTDAIREQLGTMSEKYPDEFYLDAIDEKHYQLRPIEFDIKITVIKRSGDMELRDGRYVKTSLIRFGDQYWINGMISQGPWDKNGRQLLNLTEMLPEIYRSKPQQSQYLETLGIQAAVFYITFGSFLHIETDIPTAAKKLNDFAAEVQRHLNDRFGDNEAVVEIPPLHLHSLNAGNGIGLFFDATKGIILSPELPLIIDFLSGKSTKLDAKSVFFTLFGQLPNVLSRFVAEHFPMERLESEPGLVPDIRKNAAALGWFLGIGNGS